MRRVLLLLVALAVATLSFGGVALAVNKYCPANCFGTQNADTLSGSPQRNVIKALGRGDLVHGWRGDDKLYGNPGGDALYGDYADDQVYGGDGNDFVEGGYGNDVISTGDGSDKVAARDGFRDRVLCGQGDRDVVYIDPNLDTTKGCDVTTNQEPTP